jgi:hypothetical protein
MGVCSVFEPKEKLTQKEWFNYLYNRNKLGI